MPVFIVLGREGRAFSVLDKNTGKKQQIQRADFSATIRVGSGVLFPQQ
jgi:hypothetical protein